MLQEGEAPVVIGELKNGRITSVPEAEQFQQQLDPKTHDVNDRVKRRDKLVKVDLEDPNDRYDGEHTPETINVTPDANGEAAAFRIEPVARVAVAIQKLIVKRAVAFTFGNPVGLNAEPQEGSREEDVFKAVKRVLFDVKSRTLNRKVARVIYSSTEAAELWYPVELPAESSRYGIKSKFKLRVAVLSPLKGDKLYPYFSEDGDLIAFSREYVIKDSKGVEHRYFETYTDAAHFRWTLETDSWNLIEGFPKANIIGKIPVVYGSQPEVEWADVQNLIDRLEKLLSNFADTNDYHASPKIFTKGDIHGWSKKGESGAVIEGDENADAKYLSWAQAPESVKLEIETLLRLIYTITQTPDISWDSVKGLNVSGVALKLLFMDAHLKVQDKCEIFDEYLQRRLSIIQAFLKVMATSDTAFSAACESLTIEPEITPFMIEDEAGTVNLLTAATGNKAIISRKTAVSTLGWVNDVDAEIEQIESEEAAGSFADVLEPSL